MARSQKLGAADVAWLRMESSVNPMTIVGVLGFSAPLDLHQLRRLVEERLLIYERFRQRVTDLTGTPTWRSDPHFDLGAHVHRAGLPAPGGKAAIEELVSDLMSTPLDLSKPPWQFHLVEDFDGGSVLIVRLHHCLGDGIALIHVLISMADEYFDPERPLPDYGREPRSGGLLGSLLKPVGEAVTTAGRAVSGTISGGIGVIQRPAKVLDWARQGMSVGAAASKIALLPSDSASRFKQPAGVVKRASWSAPIPLGRVKAVGRSVDAKLNDVLMAAVAGGIRRYFEAHAEPTDGVEVGAAIPVNLRSPADAFDLGNVFGLAFLSLPVGIVDARERLVEIKARMDRIKSSAEPAVAFSILQAIGAGPKLLHERVVEILSAKVSAVLTNVPGPPERLHLAGSPISRLMFWVPRAGNIGLGVSIISYADEVMLGIATDARMAPDPEALVRGFHDELDALTAEFVR